MMKKILCISESCCDLIFTGLPQIPTLGEEIYGNDFCIKSGGGSNTPISLGYLGADVSYLTKIGDDDLGTYISTALEKAGVKLTKNAVVRGARTAVSAVLSTSTDRCFASFMEPSSAFAMADIEEAIKECDIVHTFIGYARTYHIHELCQKYGKELSLDSSYGDTMGEEELCRFLSCCDYLKVNEDEAKALTGLSDSMEAIKKLHTLVKQFVVVTLGAKGSIGMEKGKDNVIFVFPESMGAFVDACGAGDAYSAGLLYGLSNFCSLERSMKMGSLTSAYAVTWAGGTDPRMSNLKNRLEYSSQ